MSTIWLKMQPGFTTKKDLFLHQNCRDRPFKHVYKRRGEIEKGSVERDGQRVTKGEGNEVGGGKITDCTGGSRILVMEI